MFKGLNIFIKKLKARKGGWVYIKQIYPYDYSIVDTYVMQNRGIAKIETTITIEKTKDVDEKN